MSNNFSNLSHLVSQIEKDKGINKQIIIDSIIQGVSAAVRKKYGTYREIEVQYNENEGDLEIFEFKEVVDLKNFVDEEIEIPYEEAKKLDATVVTGDMIGIKMELNELGRISAQVAKQVIMQKVRNAESEVIFNEFEQRKGEIASGIVRRVERQVVVVDLGRIEAYLLRREQIRGEEYRHGDRVQGYISDVRLTGRGPQIIMSRTDNRYLEKLFANEVPEINEGIIEIRAVAREPGQRAKVAVHSSDTSIDPVGSCVGMRGSRVQNITQELRGEKIDVILWSEDIAQLASSALAPAEINTVLVDEKKREMEVIIADDQLSLAIGKKGMNVRLASRLIGWRLDVVSESQTSAKSAQTVLKFMSLGCSEEQALLLKSAYIISYKQLSEIDTEELKKILHLEDAEKAQTILEAAKKAAETETEQEVERKAVPAPTHHDTSKTTAQMQAEQTLKKEIEKLHTTEGKVTE